MAKSSLQQSFWERVCACGCGTPVLKTWVRGHSSYRDKKETKSCSKCGVTKPIDEFGWNQWRTQASGKRTRYRVSPCLECKKEADRPIGPKFQIKGTARTKPLPKEKTCKACGFLKPANEFVLLRPKSTSGVRSLSYGYCVECQRKKSREFSPEKKRGYSLASNAKRRANPEKKASDKKYRADYFQKNKERIRLRNKKYRDENLPKLRLRYIAAVQKKKSSGFRRDIKAVEEAMQYTLGDYRIGNQYWDVYDSCLIDKPTIDHIVPIIAGGGHDAENMTVTSHANNSSKNKTPLIVWMARRAALMENGTQ